MKVLRRQSGFSLIEMLSVVAVMLILFSIVVGLGKRIKRQAQENLCKSTIEIIYNGIQQYYDQHGEFPFVAGTGFVQDDLDAVLDDNIGDGSIKTGDDETVELNDYASSEALYYYLDGKCANSKKIIDTLNPSLVTSFVGADHKDYQGKKRGFWLDGNTGAPDVDLLRFVDPWGKCLVYTYTAGDVFPVVASAGSDGNWDTSDDIAGE